MKKRKIRSLEMFSLFVAVLCLSVSFLAFSSQLKIQSDLTANPDDLTFKVVFSTSHKKEETNPVEPKIEPRSSKATATNAIIINKKDPMITNLQVNFTKPGQRARYTFYIYNAGEYMAYLNSIIYENVDGLNAKKICMDKNGKTDDTMKKVCDNIKIHVETGNIHTSESLYYIDNRYLKPRTAQKIEVTIEYLKGKDIANKEFEVIFGDIKLNFSMFPPKATA
ncbi:MAG: hypothetical protein IKL65_04850 [Bacilli bacterium]|nr:hypothetical protein [Bacilli bacterium]